VSGLSVVLVGPIQQEPLSLQYLAAALHRAGHRAEVVPYSYRSDLDDAVRAIVERAPDVVGFGLAFQNNIEDYLAIMRAVRPAGFQGHMTCGGHVPTFCWEELLRDVPDLDTVVRHEGEHTLVEVLDALAAGRPPRDIAGLVWREGEAIVKGAVRPPEVELDVLPVPSRSPEPYLVGGLTVDFVITARGCVGECSYCSIAAFGAEGGVPFRLRQPEAVADEVAALYHERGARVIFVQDDLFVLPSEKKTVDRVDRIRATLDRHGVGDVVFWVKGRPETITPAVCRALVRMGTIHMFLGVESASAERLDYLGRTHLPIHNQSAIEVARAHDIIPSFNFMLFDPDCTLEDIAATLDMAALHLDLPWNVCRTEVYSGTELKERLAREGRLEGDYRSYGYVMHDLRAEVLFRILRVALHERALEIDSLLNRLISLSFARQLHDHFFPGKTTEHLSRAVIELGVAVRKDTLDAIRRAFDYVASHDLHDKKAVRRFAVSLAFDLGRRDLPWRRETDRLWNTLNVRGMRKTAVHAARVRSGFAVAAGS
jgi:anaerobic magnesium-protoporphyrin IX monomethyl ester cyclase